MDTDGHGFFLLGFLYGGDLLGGILVGIGLYKLGLLFFYEGWGVDGEDY